MTIRRALGVVLATILLCEAPSRAQSPSARESEGLAGPVHVLSAESAYARRAGDQLVEEKGRRRRHDTVAFDAAGNFSEREVMDDYGFPVGKQSYTYERGRIVEIVLKDEKGALLERRRYGYANGDTPESLAITARDGSGYVERYTRGAGGRLDQITYLVGQREMGRTAFTYEGAAEQPAGVAFFDASGKRATAPVGPCLGAHRLEYRYANGALAERALYEVDGTLKRRSLYQYDTRGNVTEEIRSGGFSGARFTYEYELDARGNWIKRVGTTRYDMSGRDGDDGIVNVTYRTITYY
jgi:hypothetical protein